MTGWHSWLLLPVRPSGWRRLYVLGGLTVLVLALASLPRLQTAWAQPAGTWTTGPSLGTVRTEVAAAALDGILYVVGQYPGSSGPPGANEAFDPAVGRWAFRAPLPADLNQACAAPVDGRLYVVGGYDPPGAAVATTFAYDPAA